MAAETDALSRCKACIKEKRSFVLQGGAGSGKTESLKELLLYIRSENPGASVVCITHTNAAADEITRRVGGGFCVSTIHSFLYGLMGMYRKNIRQEIPTLFQLEHKAADCADYDAYRKLYVQYRKKCYDIFREETGAVLQKKDYNRDPAGHNQTLNQQIGELNQRIARAIHAAELPDRFYNETRFDSFRDRSFGHDGLLTVFHTIFRRYPLFQRILRDKFDYIFIDEYQDTNGDILKDFLDLSQEGKLAVCLFGDGMQSIYDRGIGDLDAYIGKGTLADIPKEDNFRCSFEVIDLINTLRTDGIRQKVALKTVNGVMETADDRHGSARVWYTVVDRKPHAKSPEREKRQYQKLVERMIGQARAAMGDPSECKVLILTNKEIARRNGFAQLYKVFHERFSTDAGDRIENCLRRIQALEVAELCRLYEKKQYNELICRVKKNGYEIRTGHDKTKLREILEDLITGRGRSMWQAVELAVSGGLIRQTEACSNEAARRDRQETDPRYHAFCTHYHNGSNTYAKLKKVWEISSEEEFRRYESKLKRARFYQALFSDAVKFAEVRSYDAYLDEAPEYITMHRTKGTGIRSVIVVMEEFFWNDYDFSQIYMPAAEKSKKQERSRKLIYVACSRAAQDLVCIRVLTAGEEDAFKSRFPQAEKIHVTD